MAKQSVSKSKKNNNNLLIGVFGALLTLIVIAIVAIVLLNSKGNPNNNASFFETDDTKYVVTVDYGQESELSPLRSYDIYYHGEDGNITAHESYYEFVDAATAQAALPDYEKIKEQDSEFVSEVKLDGKYIIMVATPVQYEGLTVEFVKQWSEIDYSELESLEDEGSTEEGGEVVEETAPCGESVDGEPTDC